MREKLFCLSFLIFLGLIFSGISGHAAGGEAREGVFDFLTARVLDAVLFLDELVKNFLSALKNLAADFLAATKTAFSNSANEELVATISQSAAGLRMETSKTEPPTNSTEPENVGIKTASAPIKKVAEKNSAANREQKKVSKAKESLIDKEERPSEDDELVTELTDAKDSELVLDDSHEEAGVENDCRFEGTGKARFQGVVINEVAWAGGPDGSTKEWIELKNIKGAAADISDWYLVDKKEDVKIKFDPGTVLPKNGFYLLERTSDEATIAAADLIYKGALSNKSEGLRLFSSSCELADEVIAEPSWPAGDEKTKATMERGEDFSWHTSSEVFGTPRRNNTPGVIENKTEPLSKNWAPQPSGAEALVLFRINEIMYDLPGTDSGREWIEVVNAGETAYDITQLKLRENKVDHLIKLVKGRQILEVGDYAVIADNPEKFLIDYPNFSGNLFDSSFSLSNIGEAIAIIKGENEIYSTTYEKTWGAQGDGKSLQFIDGAWTTGEPSPGNQSQKKVGAQYGTNVVISEIQVEGVDAGDEFIEVYNPFSESVGLAGWSLQYLSGSAATTSSIAKKNFDSDAVIPAGGYFLVVRGKNGSGSDGYTGGVPPDMTQRTFSMSHALTGGIVFLMSTTTLFQGFGDEALVDYVAYGNAVLNEAATTTMPDAFQSAERKAWSDGLCLDSAVGIYEFSGNGCDSDTGSDFEIRPVARPQNTASLPEPRPAPTMPISASGTEGFVSYATSSSELVFNWDFSRDALGATSTVSYKMMFLDVATTTVIYTGTSTSHVITISELGRDYVFELNALDSDGLTSATTSFSIFVPTHEPPSAPVLSITDFDATSSIATLSWSSSTDADTAEDLLRYETGYTTSTELIESDWMDATGYFSTSTFVFSGIDYFFGVRVRDDFGNVASSTITHRFSTSTEL